MKWARGHTRLTRRRTLFQRLWTRGAIKSSRVLNIAFVLNPVKNLVLLSSFNSVEWGGFLHLHVLNSFWRQTIFLKCTFFSHSRRFTFLFNASNVHFILQREVRAWVRNRNVENHIINKLKKFTLETLCLSLSASRMCSSFDYTSPRLSSVTSCSRVFMIFIEDRQSFWVISVLFKCFSFWNIHILIMFT